MKYLDLTLGQAAGDVALDEALLDWAEEESGQEILRLWEARERFVVVGYGNHWQAEVDAAACERLRVPVIRRCSGGGSVLQGPGCLNYALILEIDEAAPTGTITGTNQWVMGRHRHALGPLLNDHGPVTVQGHTDLAVGPWKFSGNAQRRRKKFLLFHGTFLLSLEIGFMAEVLKVPGREPEYRGGRTHRQFVKNTGLSPAAVKNALREVWGATEALNEFPERRLRELIADKYSQKWWTEKR